MAHNLRASGGYRYQCGLKSRRTGGETGLSWLGFAFTGITYPQYFLPKLVEYVCRKASVCIEHLPFEHASHPQILLRHKSNMLSLRIHDHVFVRLLESHHHIHELELSCHHYGGVCQYAGGGVFLVKHAIWVFRDVDW